MNRKWLLIALLIFSCKSHPNTEGSSSDHTAPVSSTQDSLVKAGKQKFADSLAAISANKPGISSVDTTVAPQVDSPAIVSVGKQVANFIVDLNSDQIPDTLSLRSSLQDSSLFNTITVSLANYEKKTFRTSESWTDLDDWFLKDNKGKNLLNTTKLFLAKGKNQSVLLLFGIIDGAGYRENFSIINIEDNRSKEVLNQNERKLDIEIPLSLSDLDGDGRLDFLFRELMEYNGQPDTLGGKIGSYSPFFVYSVDSNCQLNKPLMIHYNEKHYLFAGFQYDEGTEVFYPNDHSKPRLWKP